MGAAALAALPVTRDNGAGRRHRAGSQRYRINAKRNGREKSKANRFEALAAWAVARLGPESLTGSSGVGVLDVAGGKGLLSFELALMHGVPSTVVDVTKVRLSLFKSKQLLGLPLLDPSKETPHPDDLDPSGARSNGSIAVLRERRRRCGSLLAFIDDSLKVDPSRVPQLAALEVREHLLPLYQLCVLFDDDFLSGRPGNKPRADATATDDGSSNGGSIEGGGSTGGSTGSPDGRSNGEHNGGGGSNGISNGSATTNGVSNGDGVDTKGLWEGCSCVLAMHPDEATEPIVDACL